VEIRKKEVEGADSQYWPRDSKTSVVANQKKREDRWCPGLQSRKRNKQEEKLRERMKAGESQK